MPRKLSKRFQRWKRKVVDGWLLRGYRFHGADTLVLETTNVCTLRCSCCPNGHPEVPLRPRGIMSRETFDTFLRHLDMPVKQCFLHMCGEPLLNREIPYFAEQLLQRKITPVLFSNGYKVDEQLVEQLLSLRGPLRMAFSMDLLSPTHYERIRKPGRYETAMACLERLNVIFASRNRYFGLNIIVDPERTDQLETDCERLFGTYSRLNKISLSAEFPWPGLPNVGDVHGHLSRHPAICSQALEMPCVLWNGDVSFCNFDYAGQRIVGSILKDTYRTLFNGRETRRIRRHLLMRDLADEPLCSQCLMPRCETLSDTLLRGKFGKMDARERTAFFGQFRTYYPVFEQ